MARTKPGPKRRASAAPRAKRGKSKTTAPTTAETSTAGAKANTENAITNVAPTRKSARISEKKARKAKAAAEATAAAVKHTTLATAAAAVKYEEFRPCSHSCQLFHQLRPAFAPLLKGSIAARGQRYKYSRPLASCL